MIRRSTAAGILVPKKEEQYRTWQQNAVFGLQALLWGLSSLIWGLRHRRTSTSPRINLTLDVKHEALHFSADAASPSRGDIQRRSGPSSCTAFYVVLDCERLFMKLSCQLAALQPMDLDRAV